MVLASDYIHELREALENNDLPLNFWILSLTDGILHAAEGFKNIQLMNSLAVGVADGLRLRIQSSMYEYSCLMFLVFTVNETLVETSGEQIDGKDLSPLLIATSDRDRQALTKAQAFGKATSLF